MTSSVPISAPLPARFWSLVDRSGGPEACWPWRGYVSLLGYGRLHFGGRNGVQRYAHRLSYMGAHGTIPEDLELDHLCRNRACVNPTHLEPVTHRENVLRGQAPTIVASRAGVCTKGHPRDENRSIGPDGEPNWCRACGADWARLRRDALHAERHANGQCRWSACRLPRRAA